MTSKYCRYCKVQPVGDYGSTRFPLEPNVYCNDCAEVLAEQERDAIMAEAEQEWDED